jgi:anti-sigma factor RsiW
MNACWPEGGLRAYLDGELSPEDMQSVAAHLGECAACERLHAELSVRAGYVSGLMGTLSCPETRPVTARAARARTVGSWRWTAAAVAIAAGLALATLIVPKREAPRTPVARVPVPLPVAPPTVVAPPLEEPGPVEAAIRPRRRVERAEPFLALDDEPIESGIVMRVTVPGSTPADIVFSPDGRARAIRLVRGNQRSY